MLILSRTPGELIKIGEVTVTVLGVEGNKVKVGIAAPKHIPILRDDAIKTEKHTEDGQNNSG